MHNQYVDGGSKKKPNVGNIHIPKQHFIAWPFTPSCKAQFQNIFQS